METFSCFKEEQEILELDYIPFNTINDLSWVNEWQSFQNIAKTGSFVLKMSKKRQKISFFWLN